MKVRTGIRNILLNIQMTPRGFPKLTVAGFSRSVIIPQPSFSTSPIPAKRAATKRPADAPPVDWLILFTNIATAPSAISKLIDAYYAPLGNFRTVPTTQAGGDALHRTSRELLARFPRA